LFWRTIAAYGFGMDSLLELHSSLIEFLKSTHEMSLTNFLSPPTEMFSLEVQVQISFFG